MGFFEVSVGTAAKSGRWFAAFGVFEQIGIAVVAFGGIDVKYIHQTDLRRDGLRAGNY